MTTSTIPPTAPLVVSYDQLCALGIGLSRGQLSTLMRRGKFPRSFGLTEGASKLVWWYADIVVHLEGQHAKAQEQAVARSAAARQCQETKRQHPERIAAAQQKRLATIGRKQAAAEAMSSLFVDLPPRGAE